jgi:hypothetical protein
VSAGLSAYAGLPGTPPSIPLLSQLPYVFFLRWGVSIANEDRHRK